MEMHQFENHFKLLANAAIFIGLFTLSLLGFLFCYYILEIFIISSLSLLIYTFYKQYNSCLLFLFCGKYFSSLRLKKAENNERKWN